MRSLTLMIKQKSIFSEFIDLLQVAGLTFWYLVSFEKLFNYNIRIVAAVSMGCVCFLKLRCVEFDG